MTGARIMAFDSSQQALRAEMLLEEGGIAFEMIPTPGAITAGCALSLSFSAAELELVLTVVREERIEIRGIFRANETSGDASFEQLV